MQIFILVILVLFLAGCQKKLEEVREVATLFEQLPADHTGIHFSNQITESDSLNITNYEFMYNGGGVGIGDVNNDGLPDIYFTGNMTTSRLYLNQGNLSFQDITQSAGVGTSVWATGVSMVDINADGWLDIYVCVGGPDGYGSTKNLLFINLQNGTFKEQAEIYGLADQGHSIHAAFVDYDKDGDLDVYLLTNYIKRNAPGPNILHKKQVNGESPSTDRLYQNNGPGANGHPTFTNVSRQAGILTEGNGLGVAITDINQDSWPDIYVSNDFVSNDILWINNGDGTFTDKVSRYFKHQSYSSMGTDAADINNDGLVDIISLDMLPETNERRKLMLGGIGHNRFESEMRMGYDPQYMRNTLQLNRGNGSDGKPIFSEIGQLAGVYSTEWSWSPLFADFDNDGYRDLYITNGFNKDITNRDFIAYRREQSAQLVSRDEVNKNLKQAIDQIPGIKVANYGFVNNGNLTFANRTQEWGFSTPSFSNGAAFADLDRDGDLDLVVNNINDPAFVYRNRANEVSANNYLQLTLKSNTSNVNGLGCKIELYHGSKYQFYEHSIYRGYQSTVDPFIHFGLGKEALVDSLHISWPDGKRQVLKQIKTNQVLLLHQREATKHRDLAPVEASPLLEDISDSRGLSYAHKEELYIDFNIQPLLPHKYSQNGPGITVGDVNGDGLEDFFVGGAFNYSGCFFIQQANGSFKKRVLTQDVKYEEDMGVLLFDADNDKDLDLYIVSGSSEFEMGSKYYQDRLYKNDGKGNFELDSEALPAMRSSGSCVTACDYDKDGDLDLFVGGRIVPGRYPATPQSYLLSNDNGRFQDISNSCGDPLNKIGMVTSALWTDVDNDGWIDLMVTGEWMPVTVFKNSQGKFSNITQSAGLSQSTGWWNSLTSGDFDNDGDLDYVAGNLGLNSKYKASAEEPVEVIAKDFDGNGTLDPIMSHYINGMAYPAHARDDVGLQLVGMKRKFTSYSSYAKASFKDVISGLDLRNAYRLNAKLFETSYIENQGNGTFIFKKLPVEAQFAPVFGMLSDDFDGDGLLDVMLIGNSYATEVATGRYDAMNGLLLKGDGRGNFTPIPTKKSGFDVGGDAKGLVQLYTNQNEKVVLATQNNAMLKAFHSTLGYDRKRINFTTSDVAAEVIFKNGYSRKHELYFGSSYLSHTSRSLMIDSTVSQIIAIDFMGVKRIITR